MCHVLYLLLAKAAVERTVQRTSGDANIALGIAETKTASRGNISLVEN